MNSFMTGKILTPPAHDHSHDADSHELHKSGDAEQEFAYHIAWLRLLAIWFQHAHWAVQGSTFYGDHLLYERIYGEVNGLIDGMAEKAVSFTSPNVVNTHMHAELLSQMLRAYPTPSRVNEATMIAAAGLALVKDYLETLKETYDKIKSEGGMSMGLDDLLMSNANTIEGFVYLLKQRVQKTIG